MTATLFDHEIVTEVSDYRYTLTRRVDRGHTTVANTLCWVMLNPSTADETFDDPTIRRVTRFTFDHGFANLIVVNHFALRATNPKHLIDAAENGIDPIGQHNPWHIADAFDRSGAIVFAWGAWLDNRRLRTLDLPAFCTRRRLQPWCLGTTKSGAPRHPLYVTADQPLIRWQP